MSSKANSVVNICLTPTEPDPHENMHPVGVFPVLPIDHELVPSIQHEHSERPELYETPPANEASPMLEASDQSGQSMTQHANFGDQPPVVVSFRGDAMLMEAAASGYSNLGQEGDSPYPSKTMMYDPPEIDNLAFYSGDFTTQGNFTLSVSLSYSLSRFFTVDPHNESLRHEAGIAVSRGLVQEGQNMFIKRIVELSWGIDTLFNS